MTDPADPPLRSIIVDGFTVKYHGDVDPTPEQLAPIRALIRQMVATRVDEALRARRAVTD